jgi:signal transduction histidine kinase
VECVRPEPAHAEGTQASAGRAEPRSVVAPGSTIVVTSTRAGLGDDRRPDRYLDAGDWASSPLGPVSTWSGERRGVVETVLAMPYPATVLFGADAIVVCNRAFAELSERPARCLLGRPAAMAWPGFPAFDAVLIGAAHAGERRSLTWQQPGDDVGVLVIATEAAQPAPTPTDAADARQAAKLRALGEMASGIAHDFNNLLTGVLGNLDLAAAHVRHGAGAEAESYLDGARSAAQRAAGFAQRLLGFVRDSGPASTPVEIAAVIDAGAGVMRGMLGGGIRLRLACDSGLWPVQGDVDLLESGLLNLASNSRDAMPDGGSLVISAQNARFDEAAARALGLPVAGDYVVVSVVDSGSGMSARVADRALEPFFTTKDSGNGTGLGLATTRDAVTAFGGEVTIASVQGVGTTVRLYLPRFPTSLEPRSDPSGRGK